MGTQLYEHSEGHTGFYTVKWVKYMVCGFYLKIKLFLKNGNWEPWKVNNAKDVYRLTESCSPAWAQGQEKSPTRDPSNETGSSVRNASSGGAKENETGKHSLRIYSHKQPSHELAVLIHPACEVKKKKNLRREFIFKSHGFGVSQVTGRNTRGT